SPPPFPMPNMPTTTSPAPTGDGLSSQSQGPNDAHVMTSAPSAAAEPDRYAASNTPSDPSATASTRASEMEAGAPKNGVANPSTPATSGNNDDTMRVASTALSTPPQALDASPPAAAATAPSVATDGASAHEPAELGTYVDSQNVLLRFAADAGNWLRL